MNALVCNPPTKVSPVVHKILASIFKMIGFPITTAFIFKRRPGSSFSRDRILRSLIWNIFANIVLVRKQMDICPYFDHVENWALMNGAFTVGLGLGETRRAAVHSRIRTLVAICQRNPLASGGLPGACSGGFVCKTVYFVLVGSARTFVFTLALAFGLAAGP